VDAENLARRKATNAMSMLKFGKVRNRRVREETAKAVIPGRDDEVANPMQHRKQPKRCFAAK
jgi:hypothetical protein